MADLDAEFALFQAELAAVEDTVAATGEGEQQAPSQDAAPPPALAPPTKAPPPMRPPPVAAPPRFAPPPVVAAAPPSKPSLPPPMAPPPMSGPAMPSYISQQAPAYDQEALMAMGMGGGMGMGMGGMGVGMGMGQGGGPGGAGGNPGGAGGSRPGGAGGQGGAGGKPQQVGKKKALLREAGGEKWVDPTLTEWPENDFRIFVGDLGNEVTDELLAKSFNKYSSFAKAKIVRDPRTKKSKGYGFVSFLDGNDFAKAMREMNGKYIGNRPCKLSKSTWGERTIKKVNYREPPPKKQKPMPPGKPGGGFGGGFGNKF